MDGRHRRRYARSSLLRRILCIAGCLAGCFGAVGVAEVIGELVASEFEKAGPELGERGGAA